MPRNLLDDVIAMKYVRYRFTGEAEIGNSADITLPLNTIISVDAE